MSFRQGIPLPSSYFSRFPTETRIDYYGDPLRDFGLPHFLERFAFKNPKKLDAPQAAEGAAVAHKRYMAHGARGKSVRSLTKANCTEDEMFIFNFLEHKRRQAEIVAQNKKQLGVKKEEEDQEQDGEAGEEYLKEGEVDDDEFEAYLDGYFGKKFKDGDEQDDEELNFLEELGGEMQADKSKDKKKKKAADKVEEDDAEDIDEDWGDDDLGEEDGDEDEAGEDQSDDETGSIDLEPLDEDEDDDDDDDEGSSSEAPESPDEDDDDEDGPSRSKKSRKDSTGMFNGRSFAKTLKQSHGKSLNSLLFPPTSYLDPP